jgi:NADPH2:quinone reductase
MHGSLAFYASRGNPNPVVPAGGLVRLNASVHAISLPTSPLASRQRAQRDITAWLKSGHARCMVAGRFTLNETVAAHQAVERGDKLGTVVVEPERH